MNRTNRAEGQLEPNTVEESAMVFCALEFQEKTPLARFIKYPVVDRRVAESLAQSESA